MPVSANEKVKKLREYITAKSLIAASSGMGYYVKVSLTYANYNKAIVGIIFIGVVVTGLNTAVEALKKKFVTWEY